MTRNLEGIVLKKRNWRENDLEISFFSQECGKIRLLAIGGRKMMSKLSGQLEPFNELKIMLAEGRTVDKVGQAVSRSNFLSKMEILGWEKILSAQEAAELLDKILPEKQPEVRIYNLFKNYLLLLPRQGGENFNLLFKWQAIILAGFGPSLDSCADCGKILTSGAENISIPKGGVICSECHFRHRGDKISGRELRILGHLVKHSGSRTAWIKLKMDEIVSLKKLFNKFYTYHILK